MKYITMSILTITALLFTACGDEKEVSKSTTTQNSKDSYLGSRVSAIDAAKKSLKESNTRTKEQDKLLDSVRE